MRTPTRIDPDDIVAALNACEGDVAAAARLLTKEGVPISERTLYRRMAAHGIKPLIRYEREAVTATT